MDILHEQLNSIASALPDPVFIIDEDGFYVAVVGGCERKLYDSSAFLVGKRMQDVLPAEMAERFLAVIRQALDKGCLNVVEYPLSSMDVQGTKADGPSGLQWFEGRVYPVARPPGTKRAVVWVSVNITHRRQAFEDLKRQCEVDGLTGLYNRLSLERLFPALHEGACGANESLSLLFMDMDHFKKLNDVYGHLAGDMALRAFADFCRGLLRDADILCRYGGEEFILVLPRTRIEGAAALAQRIRSGLKALRPGYEGSCLDMTVSIGGTALRPADRRLEDLLRRADQALYEAKTQGRDRVVMRP